MSQKGIRIKLKGKKLPCGRESYFLHIYDQVTRKRRREYLGLYLISNPKTPTERNQNKETRRLAEAVLSKRILAAQEGKFGFIQKHNFEINFLTYMESLASKRKESSSKTNWSNWRSAIIQMRKFTRKDLKLSEVDESYLNGLREFLLNEKLTKSNTKLSRNAAACYFQKVKAAINEAFNNKMIPENPASRVKSIKAEETHREFLTEEEIRILFNTPCRQDRVKKAFLFSVLTGLRFSDLIKLDWRDLQHSADQGHFVRFRQQKTKGYETLPLNTQAVDLLGKKGKDEERIFKGIKYSAQFNQVLKSWIKEAGIKKHITFHCGRHTHACLLLAQGVDIYTLSKLLGHRELKTTTIYLKVMDKNKIEAIEGLPSFN